jgi:hypothetical protein
MKHRHDCFLWFVEPFGLFFARFDDGDDHLAVGRISFLFVADHCRGGSLVVACDDFLRLLADVRCLQFGVGLVFLSGAVNVIVELAVAPVQTLNRRCECDLSRLCRFADRMRYLAKRLETEISNHFRFRSASQNVRALRAYAGDQAVDVGFVLCLSRMLILESCCIASRYKRVAATSEGRTLETAAWASEPSGDTTSSNTTSNAMGTGRRTWRADIRMCSRRLHKAHTLCRFYGTHPFFNQPLRHGVPAAWRASSVFRWLASLSGWFGLGGLEEEEQLGAAPASPTPLLPLVL